VGAHDPARLARCRQSVRRVLAGVGSGFDARRTRLAQSLCLGPRANAALERIKDAGRDRVVVAAGKA
jgi:hypothetical protein